MKCKKVNKIFTKLVLLLCIVIVTITLYLIAMSYIEKRNSINGNEELIQEVVNSDTTEIDWNKLKEINPDIVGWIIVPGTNINYPILKTNNDLYYLTHTYEKEYNKNGSIIITDENTNLFNDNEISIYGHNMRNGNMFSILKNYMDSNFFTSHQKLYIYTPECDYEGSIFSVFSSNVFREESNVKELEFIDKLEYYKIKSVHNSSLELENTDKIIRLITCSYLNTTTNPTQERYYIIASLKKIN